MLVDELFLDFCKKNGIDVNILTETHLILLKELFIEANCELILHEEDCECCGQESDSNTQED